MTDTPAEQAPETPEARWERWERRLMIESQQMVESRHMLERLAVALAHSVGVIEALDFDPGLARSTLDDYLAWHREGFQGKEAQAE